MNEAPEGEGHAKHLAGRNGKKGKERRETATYVNGVKRPVVPNRNPFLSRVSFSVRQRPDGGSCTYSVRFCQPAAAAAATSRLRVPHPP